MAELLALPRVAPSVDGLPCSAPPCRAIRPPLPGARTSLQDAQLLGNTGVAYLNSGLGRFYAVNVSDPIQVSVRTLLSSR